MSRTSRIARRAAIAAAALAMFPAAASAQEVSVGPHHVAEGTGGTTTFWVPVEMDRPANGGEMVEIEIAQGSAAWDQDFFGPDLAVVEFSNDSDTAWFPLEINADDVVEATEELYIAVVDADPGIDFENDWHAVEILDDDEAGIGEEVQDVIDDIGRLRLDTRNDIGLDLECPLQGGCRGNVELRLAAPAAGLAVGTVLGTENLALRAGQAAEVDLGIARNVARRLRRETNVQVDAVVNLSNGLSATIGTLLRTR